ncbi:MULTISPECIES: transposase [unclassified Providencia]|nr:MULTISPECIES: transposase [unclassified Providencia]WOB84880.1 transposase [Providencia sp. PROV040]HEP0307392.1 transposase [Providencia rettgeri]
MVKQYSAEFKLEAAKIVVDHHYSVAKAAQAMGVSLVALNRWV